MLKLGIRGGRGVDLHRVELAFDHDWLIKWTEEESQQDAKFLMCQDGVWELKLYSKGHWLNDALDDATELIDLFIKCFPKLHTGDEVFNPTFHGVRKCKAKVKDHFETATKFDEVFEMVCLRRLGARLRPYAIRRFNANATQSSSTEVRTAHARLMGTSLKNLDGAYDSRSDQEKSFLATQVQRFQYDPRFEPSCQNQVLPAPHG